MRPNKLNVVSLSLIFLIAISAVHASQAKKPKFMTDAYKLSASIYDVKSMGKWKKGKESGHIRLVIARSNKRDEIYLQWIKWDEKGPASVKSTVMIKEIQQAANFKSTFIRREVIEGKRQIVIGLENLHNKTTQRAIVEVTGVGRYKCTL